MRPLTQVQNPKQARWFPVNSTIRAVSTWRRFRLPVYKRPSYQPASALSMRCHHNKRKGRALSAAPPLAPGLRPDRRPAVSDRAFQLASGRGDPPRGTSKNSSRRTWRPEDNQAKRQRRRQDKTDRSPDPAPENGGDNHCRRRQACAAAIHHGLQDLAGYALGDDDGPRLPRRQPMTSLLPSLSAAPSCGQPTTTMGQRGECSSSSPR